MQEIIINQLLEIANPLFDLSGSLRDAAKGAGLPDDFRDKIEKYFATMEHVAMQRSIPITLVQDMKYAMAAFIDELILKSAWLRKHEWMAQPLQLQFFGEHLAGENFFQRLTELRQDGVRNIDLLEVFYVCLQLGFEGMYRLNNTEKLQALQIALRGQIEAVRGIVDPRLAPHALPEGGFVERMGRELPFWVIATITAALLFFIYVGYSVVINHQVNIALAQLTADQISLTKEQ